jgi:outer membrane protein assembly factor BamB
MVRIAKKIGVSLVGFALLIPSSGHGAAVGLSKREKSPYKPVWVSGVKKGKGSQYKRKEFSSPRIFRDSVFVGSSGGFFHCMRKGDGRKLWRFKTAGSVSSAPAFWEEGNQVFIGDDEGVLYALSADEGKEIWRQELKSEILAAPAVRGNRLYVATVEGKVVSLSAPDGKILWEKEHPLEGFRMTVRGNSPPVLDENGDRLYVGFADGTLWALSSGDGRLVWEKSFRKGKGFSDIDGAPAVDGDRLYAATFDGGLFALSRTTGQTLWSQEIGSGVRLLAHGETLFVSGSDGRLYAFQKKDGTKLWDLKLGRGALTAPVAYQDLIAVGLSEEALNFIRAGDGHLIAKRFAKKGIFSDPVVEGDRIYFLSNGGRLYSLRFVR